VSPARQAQALGEFAATELDSAWQSMNALQQIDDPRLRAKLFQHALEELDHSCRFERLFRTYSAEPGSSARFERTVLFDSSRGERAAIEFFAYECVGESAIRDEFRTYANAAPGRDVKDVFLGVERDELGHAAYTDAVLRGLVGGNRWSRRRALLGAQWRRGQEAWLRFGRKIGEVPTGVLLALLYFAFGGLLRRRCRRAVGRAGR